MVMALMMIAVFFVLFTSYLTYTTFEQKRGARFVASRLRLRLDSWLEHLAGGVTHAMRYVVRYIITLSWYYSLHALLKVFLRFLAGVYHAVEAVLIRNRDRARVIRKEKRSAGHLEAIAEHKAETKLTAAEIRKRKDKALKGR